MNLAEPKLANESVALLMYGRGTDTSRDGAAREAGSDGRLPHVPSAGERDVDTHATSPAD